MDYPETKRENIAEDMFGISIDDPYRWLESDSRRDPEVAGWVETQNLVSAADMWAFAVYWAGLEFGKRPR